MDVLSGYGPAAQHALWAIRHSASPTLARLEPTLTSMQVVEDGCVPPARLADYVRGVRSALASTGLRGVIFGHAGDAHVHVNALVDTHKPEWRAQVRDLFARVTDLTESLGGTMAGEHGDGRLRSPLLSRFWPTEALDLFADIKRCFDPHHVLNPGVKTGPYADPFERIKYDPLLAALPANARAVLARVEAERSYNRKRLEMLDAIG